MQTISGGLFHAMNQAQATYYEAYYLPLMCTIIAHCLLHKQVAMHHTRGGMDSGQETNVAGRENWDNQGGRSGAGEPGKAS